MTSNQEDTLVYIHTEVTQSNLWTEFNAQLKKMSYQPKHKWKTTAERWEYALSKVKGGSPKQI
jgi:hypothetical protein